MRRVHDSGPETKIRMPLGVVVGGGAVGVQRS